MDIERGASVYLRKTCRAGNPCLIFLVEDEPYVAQMLNDAIQQFEPGCFSLEHVETLEEAGAKLAAVTYDLVICDLCLKQSEGYSTFAVVKHLVPENTAVAVLTGNDDEEVEIRCIEAGAIAFVVKPIPNLAHFLRRMRGWILKARRDNKIRAHDMMV